MSHAAKPTDFSEKEQASKSRLIPLPANSFIPLKTKLKPLPEGCGFIPFDGKIEPLPKEW